MAARKQVGLAHSPGDAARVGHVPTHGRGESFGTIGKPVLRIFTYLPNPRIWKATISIARLGEDKDVRAMRRSIY
jgi:hypothetical protein